MDRRGALLFLAAEAGGIEACKALLDAGASVNARDSDNRTPLHFAASNGHQGVCSLLIDRNASVDARDSIKLAPLHLAAFEGHQDVCMLLIDRNASVDARDINNLAPLHCAAVNGHQEVCSLLIDRNASIDARDSIKLAPLHHAAIKGHQDVCMLLIDCNAAIDAQDSNNPSPLHFAAFEGHQEVCSLLIDRNASIDARDPNNRTPLHEAATNGHQDVCKLLIDRNASIDAQDPNNRTPLHNAAIRGHQDICKLLIDRNAAIDAQDSNSLSPLHFAASEGHQEVCKLLIDRNASVDARDIINSTPLHGAAITGHQEVCKLLLDRNATIDARGPFNFTPLHGAASKGHRDVCKLLLNNRADPNAFNVPILKSAVLCEGSSVCPTLIANGAKVDAAEESGMTALHAAAVSGDIEMCQQLIDTAKDQNVELVNLPRHDGATALHFAALVNDKSIVELLLANDADPNCRTKCRKPTNTTETCTGCCKGHWSPADLTHSEKVRKILSEAAARSSLPSEPPILHLSLDTTAAQEPPLDTAPCSSQQTATSTPGQPLSGDDNTPPETREREARSELGKKEHSLSELHTHLMGMGNARFWVDVLKELPSDSSSGPRDILAHCPLIWSKDAQAFLDKETTRDIFANLLEWDNLDKLKRPDVPEPLQTYFQETDWKKLLDDLEHYELSFARDFTFEVILKLQDLFKAFGIRDGHPESVRQAVLEERLIGSTSPIRRFIIWNARHQQLQHCHGLRVSDLCRLMQEHPEVKGHVRNAFSMCSIDGSPPTESDFHSFRGSFTPEFYPRRFALKDSLYEQRLDVLAILLWHVLDRYRSCRPPVSYVEFSVGVGDICRPWVFDVLRCFGSDGTSSFRNRDWLAKRLIPEVSVIYKFLAGFGRHRVELEPNEISDAERSNRFLLERPQRAINKMLREIHASKNGEDTEIFRKFEADLRKVEQVWEDSKYSHDWVVGFDLFGDELGFPYCPFVTSRFVKFVEDARLRNPRFGLRIHCAENVPLIRPLEPEFRMFMAHMYIVFRGLEYLVTRLGGKSIRIGHGVAFAWFLQPSRDHDLGRKSSVLAEEIRALAPIALLDVIFEVNPTSNWYLLPEALRSHQFALFKDTQEFPRTTLSTDDDGVWPIDHCRLHHDDHYSLAAEYCDAISKFSLTPEQVRSMIHAGVDGRFYGFAIEREKPDPLSPSAQHHRVVVLPHVVAMRYFSPLQFDSSSDEFDAHYRQVFRLKYHFARETRLYFAELLLSKLQPLLPSLLQIQVAECAFLQFRFPGGHCPAWIAPGVWDECTRIVEALVLCEDERAFFTLPQLDDTTLHCVYSDVTQPGSNWDLLVGGLVESFFRSKGITLLEIDCFLLGSATTPEAPPEAPQQSWEESLFDSVRERAQLANCQVVLRVWTGDKSRFLTRVEANITLHLNSSSERSPASFLYAICTHGDAATFAFHKLAEDPNLILAAESHHYSATPPEAPDTVASSTGVGVEPGQNAPFLNSGSAATEHQAPEAPSSKHQAAEAPASKHQAAEAPTSDYQAAEAPSSEHQDPEAPSSKHQDPEPAPSSKHQDPEPAPSSEHQDHEPPPSVDVSRIVSVESHDESPSHQQAEEKPETSLSDEPVEEE